MGRTARSRKPIPEPDQTFVEDPERDKDADDGPPKTNGRLEGMKAGLHKHCDLQDTEDRLMELHILPIRKLKQDNKSDVMKEYDIPVESFNARAALLRIERRKDNDEVVIAINELFQACPVGESVDMIAAAERVAAKKKAEADAAAAKVAEKEKRKTTIKQNAEKAL